MAQARLELERAQQTISDLQVERLAFIRDASNMEAKLAGQKTMATQLHDDNVQLRAAQSKLQAKYDEVLRKNDELQRECEQQRQTITDLRAQESLAVLRMLLAICLATLLLTLAVALRAWLVVRTSDPACCFCPGHPVCCVPQGRVCLASEKVKILILFSLSTYDFNCLKPRFANF